MSKVTFHGCTVVDSKPADDGAILVKLEDGHLWTVLPGDLVKAYTPSTPVSTPKTDSE